MDVSPFLTIQLGEERLWNSTYRFSYNGKLTYKNVDMSSMKQNIGARLCLHEGMSLINCYYPNELDTFSFQALDFYKKLGYEIFKELEYLPNRFAQYYLIKWPNGNQTS